MTSQAAPNPLPTTTILKSTKISQSSAQQFLTAYLDRAATDPSLQPDSTLSGHGPVSANTGSAPNLVIHNLKRVQAGLAGEVLGRDLTLENLSGDTGNEGAFGSQTQNGAAEQREIGDDGWQDKQSYERQQQTDDAMTGDEGVSGNVGDEMDVGEDGMPVQNRAISKEERKQKKKERIKAERRAKATG